MFFRWALCIVDCILCGVALRLASPRSSTHGGGCNHTAVPSRAAKPRIYFFLERYVSELEANYQHMPVALGEGLSDAGYYFRSNVNYWRPSVGGAYLFKNTTESPLSFDAVVVAQRMIPHIPFEVIHRCKTSRSPKLVVLDWSDGEHAMYPVRIYNNETVDAYSTYYRAQYSTALMPTAPGRPLKVSALYLTKRIMHAAETAAFRARQQHMRRDRKYLWSDEVSPVRGVMESYLLPSLPPDMVARADTYSALPPSPSADFFYWSTTGQRHTTGSFDMMQLAQVTDCAAGRWRGGLAVQWDSLRLWEAFASGIAVVLPDLELYGMRFPVMPTRFEHYIPAVMEGAALQGLAHNLTAGDIDLAGIGAAGRRWALRHYSPKAFVERFIRDTFPLYGWGIGCYPEEEGEAGVI